MQIHVDTSLHASDGQSQPAILYIQPVSETIQTRVYLNNQTCHRLLSKVRQDALQDQQDCMQHQLLTLVIKSVRLVLPGTLMISSQQEEVFGIFDLVSQQKRYGLHRLFASINIVTQKQIVGPWWKSACLEEPQQI